MRWAETRPTLGDSRGFPACLGRFRSKYSRLDPVSISVVVWPPAQTNGELAPSAAVARTLRSLHHKVAAAGSITVLEPIPQAAPSPGPLLLIRAGVWLRNGSAFRRPPEGTDRRALAAIGMPGSSDERQVFRTAESLRWQELQAACGGDFRLPVILPLPPVAWLNPSAAELWWDTLRSGASPDDAWQVIQRQARVVRWPALDCFSDSRMRVLQILTSLQRGGAERLALDLTTELRRQGTPTLMLGLGWPTRAAYPSPPGWIDLAGYDDLVQSEWLRRIAVEFGADLFHSHLVVPERAEQLADGLIEPAWPLVQTIHNSRAGWPEGLAGQLASRTPIRSSFIACAQAVERELRAAHPAIPVRTIWNGIDANRFALPAAPRAEWRRTTRERLGIGCMDLVLLAVANPRPQKRLHLLPPILAACQQRGSPPVTTRAWLVLVGSISAGSRVAADALKEVQAAAEAFGVTAQLHWTGDAPDILPWLAAADVLVNVSAHEGLSLAQLEALAAGLPIVATDVGGAAEITGPSAVVHLLPVDAGPERFAEAIFAALHPDGASLPVTSPEPQRKPGCHLPESFTLPIMTARHRSVYEGRLRASTPTAPPKSDLWLITNNFSTGGAQSSARRLLFELNRRGRRVAVATLQEDPDSPSAGVQALRAAGIPVHILPTPDAAESFTVVTELLRLLDAHRPVAIVAWNALAEHKLQLADALENIPLFDVSPGEMYFASLERCLRRPPAGVPIRSLTEYGRRLTGVIVKYRAEAERAAALGARVHVIRNGVPLLPAKVHAARERIVLGTTARLHAHKRLDLLLAAFRRALPHLPATELLVAGEAEPGGEAHAEALRQSARDLPVRFVGEVTDVPSFLATLDVFVMISEPAGCPNASLEAMSAGLPVIATDHGGASEQVLDQVTGRLVAREDIAGLAHAMEELAHDDNRRRQWGAAGRQRVHDEFSLARMADNYERLVRVVETAPDACGTEIFH